MDMVTCAVHTDLVGSDKAEGIGCLDMEGSVVQDKAQGRPGRDPYARYHVPVLLSYPVPAADVVWGCALPPP